MGGLSDVRLQLLGKALEEGQQQRVYSAPAGLGRLGLMLHRWNTRKSLLQLDEAQLRDVGLTWDQARTEGRKPFWKD